MQRFQLDLQQTREMFIYVSRRMVESTDILTQADKAIGDGDHGIGMARGFEAVLNKLDSGSFTTLDQLLHKIGFTLMSSIGGAAGVVFGSLFLGAAKTTKGKNVLDSEELAQMLEGGLQAIKERGKAKSGDKTMIDALQPAATKAREMSVFPLDKSLLAVTEAARVGMEETKKIIATVGKAKALGERSLGHPDPGAVSTYLILKYMTEYATRVSEA